MTVFWVCEGVAAGAGDVIFSFCDVTIWGGSNVRGSRAGDIITSCTSDDVPQGTGDITL